MKKQLSYIAAAFLFAGMLSAQKIDLNAMPKPGPTPTINIAKPKTFTLSNGLTVMVVENNKLPRVSMTLRIDRPPFYEGAKVGVGQIMGDQLGNGTTRLTKDEFNKKVDFLGANLDFSSSGASANTLSKYFPEVVDLMADALINPKFSAEEIEKSKARMIEGLKSSEKSADAIASRVSNALTYGKNTSRGEFETEESLKSVTLTDVQDSYKRYIAPDNAYLIVVGDITMDKVKPLIEKAFGGWKKNNFKYPNVEPVKNLDKTEINIVDVPSAVQSVISVGNVTNLGMNSKDYFPAILANYILGGGGEARLFMNLREKNGFTYGAYSSMSTSQYSKEFSANASVRNEVTDKAVVEFMNELKAIPTVKQEELDNAKAKLKGSFIMSLERPATVAQFALNQKIYNLPDNFYTNYLKSIDNVTIADVKNAVNSNILPNNSRIFVAGKAADISEGLEKLGYPVKYFDDKANPVAKPEKKKVDANVTVASIADKYINAIGGLANVQKINSTTIDASANVQGMEMNMKMTEAKGGKMAMEINMMGQTIQKMTFDGKEGKITAQGQTIPFPEDQKQEMMKKTEIFPELMFGKSTEYQLKGIEQYNNEDCYVIKGGSTTYYYSKNTGLKVGDVKTAQGQTIPTTYSDYKEVHGVKMPYSITQNMGGMDIELKVKNITINQAKDSDFK